MKTNQNIYKTLYIDITTYKTVYKSNHIVNSMNSSSLQRNNENPNKFICSICLNQKCVNDIQAPELNKRKSRSCPVCQCSCSYSTDDSSTLTKISKQYRNNVIEDKHTKVTKDVQTSHADVSQGLTLLNEVLNVFQSKKQLVNTKERRNKTIIFKDIGVSTDNKINYRNIKPKLSLSKVFYCSIEDNNNYENKFMIVNSTQPTTIFVSHKSLDLINHKSSSIPQMKLEELKNSFKKKTKSKDAIEEANRIFAIVKRVDDKCSDSNRPMIRNGPRVLPVVKTGNVEDNQNTMHNQTIEVDKTCKPCHQNNDYMSSGDSSIKNKFCCNCNKFMLKKM